VAVIQESLGSSRWAGPSTLAEFGQVKLPNSEFPGVFPVCALTGQR